MEQKATKYSETHTLAKCFYMFAFTVCYVSNCSVGERFLHWIFAWCLVFFLSWMSKFSLYYCLAHTHLQLLNHRKILQKWGNVGTINKWSACRSDVFMRILSWFISSHRTVPPHDQFRSIWKLFSLFWFLLHVKVLIMKLLRETMVVWAWACCCSGVSPCSSVSCFLFTWAGSAQVLADEFPPKIV